jgi:hypothetical protein
MSDEKCETRRCGCSAAIYIDAVQTQNSINGDRDALEFHLKLNPRNILSESNFKPRKKQKLTLDQLRIFPRCVQQNHFHTLIENPHALGRLQFRRHCEVCGQVREQSETCCATPSSDPDLIAKPAKVRTIWYRKFCMTYNCALYLVSMTSGPAANFESACYTFIGDEASGLNVDMVRKFECECEIPFEYSVGSSSKPVRHALPSNDKVYKTVWTQKEIKVESMPVFTSPFVSGRRVTLDGLVQYRLAVNKQCAKDQWAWTDLHNVMRLKDGPSAVENFDAVYSWQARFKKKFPRFSTDEFVGCAPGRQEGQESHGGEDSEMMNQDLSQSQHTEVIDEKGQAPVSAHYLQRQYCRDVCSELTVREVATTFSGEAPEIKSLVSMCELCTKADEEVMDGSSVVTINTRSLRNGAPYNLLKYNRMVCFLIIHTLSLSQTINQLIRRRN